jgi:FMN phosphatase YigB (HAD superfamily)
MLFSGQRIYPSRYPPRAGRYASIVGIADELGIRKPAREIFEAAAAGCGLRLADGGWAIGDSPVLDIEGGRAAGLATIWVHGGRAWPMDLDPPDRVVDDVVAAVEVVLS